MFDKLFNKFRGGSENKVGRYDEKEALLAQEYASKAEGVPFAEQAGKEKYAEAEKLIKRLRDLDVDWGNIDLGKVDLNSAGECQQVQERLALAMLELQSQIREGRRKSEREVGELGKHKASLAAVAAAMGMLYFFAPRFMAEKAEAKELPGGNEPRATEVVKNNNDWGLEFFAPYIDFEKGKVDWRFLLEPTAGAIEKENDQVVKVSFDLPYEYARLFDTGKPVRPEDYEKVREYIKAQLMKELASKVHSIFQNDEDVYRERIDRLDPNDIKIVKIALLGEASPEAEKKGQGSEQPGAVDQENIDLAGLRAADADKQLQIVLKKMGIQFDKKKIKTDSRENQFSAEEMGILETISQKDGKSVYQLLVDYNRGKIEDENVKEVLKQIVDSKRKVAIMMELEGGKKEVWIVPIPLIGIITLALEEMIRRRKPDPDPRPKKPKPEPDPKPKPEPKPEPEPKLPDPPERDIPEGEPDTWKSREILIREVAMDIANHWEMYLEIIIRHSAFNLTKEGKVTKSITYDVIYAWMDHDNEVRRKIGLTPENHFDRPNQRYYGMLHAEAMRRMALDRQKNNVVLEEMDEDVRNGYIEEVCKSEIEKAVKE